MLPTLIFGGKTKMGSFKDHVIIVIRYDPALPANLLLDVRKEMMSKINQTYYTRLF